MRNLPPILMVLALSVANPAFAGDAVEKAGDLLQIILPAAALGYALESDDTQGRLQFFKSAALANGITHTLKPLLNQERPNGKDYSFPSGHTTAAFFGAAFFQRRYGWKAGLPAYAMAAFVGYSRVESHNHHLRDVLAGAAIGTGSSYLFTTPRGHFEISPYFTGDESGVAAKINW